MAIKRLQTASSTAFSNSIWYGSKTSGNVTDTLSELGGGTTKARNSNATRIGGWKWDMNYGTVNLPFALSTLNDPTLRWLIEVDFHALFLSPITGMPSPFILQARPKVSYSTDTLFGNDTEVSVPMMAGVTQADVTGVGKWQLTDQSATNFPLGAELFLYQLAADPVFTQTVEFFDIGINYSISIAKQLT